MPPAKTSLWLERVPDVPRYPALRGPLTVDTVVVGGGIAGVSAAYHLTRAGQSVALLEGNRLGTGETGFTTAFLTSSMDTPFAILRERFGDAHIQRARAAGEEGIVLVEETQAREGITCGFQRLDALALGLPPESHAHLVREANALRAANAEPAALSPGEAETLTGVSTVGALRIPQQATFDPRQYLLELATRIQKNGGQVFEGTRVTGLTFGSQVEVQTPTGTITANHAVLTTGLFPPTYRAQNKLLRQVVTYVIALKLAEPGAHWRFPPAIAWDAMEPFHYLRFLDDHLLIGGEDRPLADSTKAGDRPWQALEAFAPVIESAARWQVTHTWRGQILETPDSLPVVGVPPGGDPRVLLASGFGGNGMTLGSLAGKLTTDLITGKRSPADNPFRFDRETLLGQK